jgi:hypothetical protein
MLPVAALPPPQPAMSIQKKQMIENARKIFHGFIGWGLVFTGSEQGEVY